MKLEEVHHYRLTVKYRAKPGATGYATGRNANKLAKALGVVLHAAGSLDASTLRATLEGTNTLCVTGRNKQTLEALGRLLEQVVINHAGTVL